MDHISPVTSRLSSRERVQAAVCEAAFSYQLQQPLLDHQQPPHYYLALQGHDPDGVLLARLRALAPRVQPLSQGRVTARDGVIDRATGAHGVIVAVTRLSRVHAEAMDVVGGYYLTHQQATSLRYRVVATGGQWAVRTSHLLWRA